MKQWNKCKQDGVVLLTCLVFLLILLAMLRFVLGSAKLEEEKAGIDLDINTARESAQSALSYAEYFILRQGQLYCDPAATECNEAGMANLIFNDNSADLKNRTKSANRAKDQQAVDSISSILDKGFYTGEFIRNNTASCNPLWICVDWGESAGSVARSAKARGAKGASLPSLECQECEVMPGAVKPRYIIERYTDKELKDVNLGTIAEKAKGTVVFRITAVGFGKGSGKNLSNVMLQSTYVLPQ